MVVVAVMEKKILLQILPSHSRIPWFHLKRLLGLGVVCMSRQLRRWVAAHNMFSAEQILPSALRDPHYLGEVWFYNEA